MTWTETFLDVYKKNDVRFVSYVPDNVLTPLIKSVTSDNYFISVNATREDEAMGVFAGAWWRRRSTTSRAPRRHRAIPC
jgi:sulfopyruvate decarboxylase TPP-binding subunit